MRDCPADTGAQPTPVATCPDMWVSEDIWIRNDPIPSYSPQPYDPSGILASHWTQQPGVLNTQSALYRDPKLGRPNFIYVRVRALGSSADLSVGNEQLHVYWAKAALSLAWPLQWKGPASDPDGYIDTVPGCSQLYLGDEVTKPRRNGASATLAQRTRFINAVNHLNSTKFYVNSTLLQSISYWDNQDQIHRSMPEHTDDAFNPWHREMINRFEQLLKEYDPRVTLMYWNWVTDPSSTLSFMGAYGSLSSATRVGAPFSGLDNNFSCAGVRNTPTPFDGGCSSCGSVLPYDFTLPPSVICRELDMSTAPAADSLSLNLGNYPSFRKQLECFAHNYAHPRIGGTQNSPRWSPQDPIFFFIHANNDRIWAKWQRDQTLPSHSLDRMTSAGVYGGSTFCRLGSTVQPWDGRATAWGAGCTPARTPVYPWSGPGFASASITLKEYRDASIVTPPIYEDVPLLIPRLHGGEEVILQIPWYPPDPASYSCFGGDSGHFCLLARIEQPAVSQLGMFTLETADINFNTRQNNNIAWKNISVVNPCLGMADALGSVLVRNDSDGIVATRIRFTAEKIQGLNLLDYGTLSVDLGRELESRWAEGGAMGEGIERIRPGTVQLFGPDTSLLNVLLRPKDVFSIQVHFRLNDNYAPPGGNQYDLRVAQYGGPKDPERLLGGQHLHFDFNKIGLIMPGSTWRYLDNGIDPGADWKFLQYEDAKWRSGVAELGYGNNPITVLDRGQAANANITTYFRHKFQIDRPGLFGQLLLRIKHDDGAIAYLNGREIYRGLMPKDPITPATLATEDVQGAREKAFITVDVSNALALLQPGANLLAVEVHQSSPSSDDLSFDLELCANPEEGTTAELPTVDFMPPTEEIFFLAGRPIPLEADVFLSEGQIARVRFVEGNQELARRKSPPYSFIWSNAPLGIHTVCAIADRLGGGSSVQFRELRVVKNLNPVVNMVRPEFHAQIPEGQPFPVEAIATDDGGTIRRVTLVVKPESSWIAPPALEKVIDAPPYRTTVPGLKAGEYMAYAEAEDNSGAIQSSGPVHFEIVTAGKVEFTFDDCLQPPNASFPGANNVAHIAPDNTGGNCVLHLTDINQAGVYGVFLIPAPFETDHVDSMHMHWRSLIGGDKGDVCTATQFNRPGADGYSVNWASDLPNPPGYGNPGEEGAGKGLSVTVDTFDNGNGEAPGLEIKWRGVRIAFDNIDIDPGLAKDFLRKGFFVDADLTVEPRGQVTFKYDGRVLTAALDGWSGIHGSSLMFGARTGGACDNHWIDNITIERPSTEITCGKDLRVETKNGIIEVTWEGAGRLESSPTLVPANWTPVSNTQPGSYVATPEGATRFFRVSCAPVALSTGGPGVHLLNPKTLVASVPILNLGPANAENLRIETVVLTGANTDAPNLPTSLGDLEANSSSTLDLKFSGFAFEPEATYLVTITGTYFANGTASPFVLTPQLTVPRVGPGAKDLRTSKLEANRVKGAPFPPTEPRSALDEVNGSRWTVPDGPFIPGNPTPNGTEALPFKPGVPPALGVSPPGPPGPIVFLANSPVGVNGATLAAEPSGASGGGVIFMTANWFAAYSTDGGLTFNSLNPTTVFPADTVGFCCDQVVQYVPSIDRFIWFLQGNGYRLASASPRDIINSGGTAWTYWNLTPQVFGQPNGTGLDYPDLSVGDNFLYMSWDVGFPSCPSGCRSGFQVARVSLAGIQAGGTIGIDFTDPPDAPMAWGGHLMQNTLNEVFWAGHNSSSQMRVFSMAEGSGQYFWRDVNVASWSRTALSSTTPDGQNWVSQCGGGFPGNAVVGGTRSGNELWFAWTAGTDRNFQQPHVEMVTLDRANNFRLVRQVQIWNNSYAFAYPALATDPCSGEIGLSLEYGGNGNYQNHVVGFWGDFLVYLTSASDVGACRFGDYVTLRQAQPIRKAEGSLKLFNAFGYGLNTVPAPGSGTRTDIRYVLFGRPTSVCR